jgi:hypothetical protein
MVIEFTIEVCVVAVTEARGGGVDEVAVEVGEDPVLDVVVEVLGLEVDEVAVEVGEDPVLDAVVEVLGLEVDVLCANTPADATSIDPTKHK